MSQHEQRLTVRYDNIMRNILQRAKLMHAGPQKPSSIWRNTTFVLPPAMLV